MTFWSWFAGKVFQNSRQIERQVNLAESRLHNVMKASRMTVISFDGADKVEHIEDGLLLFSDTRNLKTRDRVAEALGGTDDICNALDSAATSAISKPGAGGGEATSFLSLAHTGHPTDRRLAGNRVLAVNARATDGGGYLILLQDISDMQQRIEGLNRRLTLATRALDLAPFGVAVLSGEGTICEVNAIFQDMVGGGVITGAHFSEIFMDEEQENIRSHLSVIAKSSPEGRDIFQPVKLHLKGENSKDITIYASQTILPGSDHIGILIHAIDVTERKRLERQFAQSQKMETVGQLAGGIAHDFNNVLTAIIGFSDLLLQRHQPGDPSFADVMQIQQNANRAASLTRQLLASSRQQTIRSRMVDVTDTLAELSTLLRQLLGEITDFSVLHGRDLWTVRGDRGQLEQIIINLCVNARDAMPNGGRLSIQTDNFTTSHPYEMGEEVMPAGDYVMICVSDTGIGMTDEVKKRLFEPFFTTKEVGQGTGLGLAMVYGSVRQMGGFIAVHSQGEGSGASFTLYLPKVRGDERKSLKNTQDIQVENVRDDTGQERILLVEDEDAVRLFSARALRSKGYDVTEARTGEVALEILSDHSFDLLITDMMMPKVDGATLIYKARENLPNIPIICISGYTRDSLAKDVAELPGTSFLSKPFSLKQLAARVRSSLESL